MRAYIEYIPDVKNVPELVHPSNLEITHESLAELQESGIFIRTYSLDSGFTAERNYGADGSLCWLWNQSWNSADEMRLDFCQNMGRGVRIEIIDELVRICST